MVIDKIKVRRLSDYKLNKFILNCELKIDEADYKLSHEKLSDRDYKIWLSIKEASVQLLQVYYEEREYRDNRESRLDEWSNS